jgi:CRISPR-associated protein Cmr4
MTTSPNNGVTLYTQQRFLFMTLDPVHIGTGGYRLGRVDMTIAREPGTNLPKIPGTSLAGATRNYAAMRYGKPEAAGQHKGLKLKDKTKCPIIYTFGTATGTESDQAPSSGTNQAGTVSVGDARILFFPVSSMAGPVWVSTVDIVKEAWKANNSELPQPTDDMIVTSLDWDGELNLGWLMFTAKKGLVVTSPKETSEWSAIKGRIVLVTSKLFSQIVNSNLEVRTSVSIDPNTGAAAQGALFTYEAIPRATWLWCDVVEDDYRKKDTANYPFPITKQYQSDKEFPKEEEWNRPLDVAKAGMGLIEYLGVGGMGTRGFGRMHLVDDWTIDKSRGKEKMS